MAESKELPLSNLERHDKYFLPDDYTVLLVEDKLFRVSTRWLEINSSKYLQIHQNGAVGSVEQPIELPYILAAELETLLDFVHESMEEGFSMSVDRWIYLLSIAHKLELKAIKPRAIREVFRGSFPPDPIRQLVLYEAYDVPRSDLNQAMRDLVVRKETLTEDEHSKLSYRTAADVMALREAYLHERVKPFNLLPGGLSKLSKALVACWVSSREPLYLDSCKL